MSNNIVPIGQATAPAAMRERLAAGAAVNRNFADGVRDSFPSLSIKGKVFRIRVDGQETPLIDPQTGQLDAVPRRGPGQRQPARWPRPTTPRASEDGDLQPARLLVAGLRAADPSVAEQGQPDLRRLPDERVRLAPSRDAPGQAAARRAPTRAASPW